MQTITITLNDNGQMNIESTFAAPVVPLVLLEAQRIVLTQALPQETPQEIKPE